VRSRPRGYGGKLILVDLVREGDLLTSFGG